ncbi:hypothetical protein KUTeg_000106 [Tegillarca granosa]|uniref:mRNA guanylyltransferase n=1 Tax=Tegillarca granosa TaxID=220873 RepID=A0ABQ9FWM6_TEGGR|nr:hypothetical protein KUTeg_000106 [Tegillarca granosa]
MFYVLEAETEDDNGNAIGDGDAGRNSFRDGRGDYKNKREFVKKVCLLILHRYMMLVDGVNEVYMIDRDNAVFHVPHLEFPRRKDLNSHIRQTLMDGGKEVGKTDFGTRLVCIEKEIIGPRYVKIQQGQLDKTKESFSVRAKPFWDCSVSRKILDGSFASQVSHEVDGLVFQPVPDPYSPGRCDSVLKWKPPDQNSIDFKLKITKENKPGMLPMTKAYLFVLGSDLPLFEMKYTKDLKELDGKIIECSWTGREWKFMRQRTDKSFPNSIKTAQGVWESIQHPVTKEILFNVCENERWMPPPKSSSGKDNELMPPPKKPRH